MSGSNDNGVPAFAFPSARGWFSWSRTTTNARAAIRACVPLDIHCVLAKSAGVALGVLRRDKFAGIMLDFDLYRSTHADPQLSGGTVAEAICETQTRQCEIFIHSQNPSGARKTFELLKRAGFSVEQCPWSSQAIQPIKFWLQELSEIESPEQSLAVCCLSAVNSI